MPKSCVTTTYCIATIGTRFLHSCSGRCVKASTPLRPRETLITIQALLASYFRTHCRVRLKKKQQTKKQVGERSVWTQHKKPSESTFLRCSKEIMLEFLLEVRLRHLHYLRYVCTCLSNVSIFPAGRFRHVICTPLPDITVLGPLLQGISFFFKKKGGT